MKGTVRWLHIVLIFLLTACVALQYRQFLTFRTDVEDRIVLLKYDNDQLKYDNFILKNKNIKDNIEFQSAVRDMIKILIEDENRINAQQETLDKLNLDYIKRHGVI